jgi:hypothetical protein
VGEVGSPRGMDKRKEETAAGGHGLVSA